MNTKHSSGLDTKGKSLHLLLLLEKDICQIETLFAVVYDDIDDSIHQFRKALKSMFASLLMVQYAIDQDSYLDLKSKFSNMSRQFAEFRESYVYLDTLKLVKKLIIDIDEYSYAIIEENIQSKHRFLVIDNKHLTLLIKNLKELTIQIREDIDSKAIVSNIKLIKKAHLKTFRKSRRLLKALSINSSPSRYHKIRKWCNYYNFQNVTLHKNGLNNVHATKYKKMHKLITYLGMEHDLQQLNTYLENNFPNLNSNIRIIISFKIKKLRRKILNTFPQFYS